MFINLLHFSCSTKVYQLVFNVCLKLLFFHTRHTLCVLCLSVSLCHTLSLTRTHARSVFKGPSATGLGNVTGLVFLFSGEEQNGSPWVWKQKPHHAYVEQCLWSSCSNDSLLYSYQACRWRALTQLLHFVLIRSHHHNFDCSSKIMLT